MHKVHNCLLGVYFTSLLLNQFGHMISIFGAQQNVRSLQAFLSISRRAACFITTESLYKDLKLPTPSQ